VDADLQLGTVPHVNELLALGVPDLRPAMLPAVFDRLTSRLASVDGIAEIAALRSEIVDWCAELAGSGVPSALDHSDLHDWQLFVSRRGGVRFFDWGDASVAHPFTSLLVTTRGLRKRLGPASARSIRDAYLDAWARYGEPAELRRIARPACRVGPIGRALTWERIFTTHASTPPHDNVIGWLRVLAEEAPI
jgi:Phosphotransferase enzyme family